MTDKNKEREPMICLKLSTLEDMIKLLGLSVKLIDSYSQTALECRALLEEIRTKQT